MRRINEIFYSLQGEGAKAGTPMVFVRFSGCNLKCPFCDTAHQDGKEMSDLEIISAIMEYPHAEWVVLTGGEPTLQIDEEFVEQVKVHTGKKIAIETNGTRPVPSNIDWVTVSPKGGMTVGLSEASSGLMAERADEIKVVETGQDLEPYFTMSCQTPSTMMCLQPCFVADEAEYETNLERTISRVLADPRWRLSLQTHRYMGIR